MIDLSGKVMIVTGGSRGIGASVCELAASLGARVLVNYKSNKEAAEAVIGKIESAGGTAIAFQADVTKNAAVQEMVNTTLEKLGTVNVLVNSAGIWKQAHIERMTDEQFRETLDVNLLGVLNCTRAIVPTMKRFGGGSIVNISSTAAQRGEAFHSHYAASKGAVTSLTKSVAAELGPNGIRVNAVSPGWTHTDMTKEALASGYDEIIAETIPLRRIGKPKESAAAVVFLASDAASYITGISLNVNGGSVMI